MPQIPLSAIEKTNLEFLREVMRRKDQQNITGSRYDMTVVHRLFSRTLLNITQDNAYVFNANTTNYIDFLTHRDRDKDVNPTKQELLWAYYMGANVTEYLLQLYIAGDFELYTLLWGTVEGRAYLLAMQSPNGSDCVTLDTQLNPKFIGFVAKGFARTQVQAIQDYLTATGIGSGKNNSGTITDAIHFALMYTSANQIGEVES